MSSQPAAVNESRLWTRAFITEFINLYRKQPCLWNRYIKEYKSVQLRNRAYDRLVEFCKPVFPKADREFVARKIQNLRGTFRKEHNKVMKERRAGGKAYVPNLWYYNLLLFTVSSGSRPKNPSPSRARFSQRVPPVSVKQEPRFSEESHDDDSAEEIEDQIFLPSQFSFSQRAVGTRVKEEPHSTSSRPNPQSVLEYTNENKRKSSTQEAMNDTSLISECPCKRHNIDEFEATGITVTQKLKRMDAFQAICAEFLINSILKKGLLKSLMPNTAICDEHCSMR